MQGNVGAPRWGEVFFLGGVGRGGCERAQMQGGITFFLFFTDTGVRTKLHPCRFRKMASAFHEELKGVTRFRVT